MIEVDGKFYVFDLEKIYKFINYSDKTEAKEKEILNNYEKGDLVTKTVRELTTPGNAQIDNIKYDLVKTFIIQILAYDGEEVELDELPLGTKLAFNTMLIEGFLKEINEE